MWNESEETKVIFASLFDKFGDSYTNEMSLNDAMSILNPHTVDDRWEALSDGEMSPDGEDLCTLERTLALSSISDGSIVSAYIMPGEGDSHSWHQCVVKERHEVTERLSLHCTEDGMNKYKLYDVPIDRDHMVSTEAPAEAREWSIFQGVLALLLDMSPDPELAVPRIQLAAAHIRDGGGTAVFSYSEALDLVCTH